ncbi:MAG TPA: DUF2339 domain-containing protein [Allosphingosinicella sp.]|jgi:uncharacterized membrane protein
MMALALLIGIAILTAPIGVGILFARISMLDSRLRRLEAELDALHRDRWRRDTAAALEPLAEEAVAFEPPPAAEAPPMAEPEQAPFTAPPEPIRSTAPDRDELPAEPPEPEEEEEQEQEQEQESESLSAMFERLVAGRLLIWVGGAAMIGAGFFLIKYSIEVGLLTPQARMIGAAIFGLALVAAGEYAGKIPRLSDDPRVAQALTGAGIVILYAVPYGSHVLYGLIDSRTAAAIMFLVSVAALVLSLRQGAATAMMGLVGGFLTPALVGDPSATAVPLLVYLTLVNGFVFGIAWRRGWTWLAAAAVAFSFAWSFYLLGRPPADAAAAGFFIIALAVAASLLRPGGGREMRYVQPMVVGLVQLAILVGRVDLGPVAWLMFGALALGAVALSTIRREHRFAPPAALLLALLVIGVKADLHDPAAPWAAAVATLLFAGVYIPLAAQSDRLLRSAMAAAALAAPFLLLRLAWPDLFVPAGWGGIALALAAAAFLLAWLQRPRAGTEPPADPAFFMAAVAAALLLGAAALDLLPHDLVAAGWLAGALLLAWFGRRMREFAFALAALIGAAVAAFRAAAMVPDLWQTAVESLVGDPALASALPAPAEALLALALPAALLVGLIAIVREPPAGTRRALAGVAGLFALAACYVLAKQVFGLADLADFERRGFAERTAITQALFLIGWLLSSQRVAAKFEQAAWLGSAVTLVAALRLIWFDMFVHNPAATPQYVGALPALNLLLPAFLLSAVWLYDARRRADAQTRSGFWLAAFLAALVMGVGLMVRQLFQGGWLNASGMPIAEVYAYSLAGLLLAVALLLGGMRLPDKAVRLAGLALLTVTIVKVFASDAQALEGVLRILSFFGLGIGLIGVGLLYGPVLRAEAVGRGR